MLYGYVLGLPHQQDCYETETGHAKVINDFTELIIMGVIKLMSLLAQQLIL